jgi:hypothetical protein
MPGPLTDSARVRDLGGLTDDVITSFAAHQLFGYANSAALDARVDREIAVASAWLQSRGGADYDSGDVVKDTLFAEAEAYLALQNLYETLKMRKVTGTHHPLVSEDSARFEALIDVEMPGHIQKFIDAYLVVEETGHPFAAPAFALSSVITPRSDPTIQTAQQDLDDILDEASGFGGEQLPRFAGGQEL